MTETSNREFQVTIWFEQFLSVDDADFLIERLEVFGTAIAVGSESSVPGVPDVITLSVSGRMPVALETALRVLQRGGLEAEPLKAEVKSWPQVEAEERS